MTDGRSGQTDADVGVIVILVGGELDRAEVGDYALQGFGRGGGGDGDGIKQGQLLFLRRRHGLNWDAHTLCAAFFSAGAAIEQ